MQKSMSQRKYVFMSKCSIKGPLSYQWKMVRDEAAVFSS